MFKVIVLEYICILITPSLYCIKFKWLCHEIYGTPLNAVKNFTYLGSTVASDNTIDVEMNNRIQAASGAFGGLRKRVWSQHGISVSTKCKVYKAIVLPTVLYSAETYTLYCRHFIKLSKVYLRHLRQILQISWKDHIPNVEVLRRANMSSTGDERSRCDRR